MKRKAAKKMIAITPAAVPESSFTWKCFWLKSQPKKEVDRWSCDTSLAASSELLIGRGESRYSANLREPFGACFLSRKRGQDKGRTQAPPDGPVTSQSVDF